MGNTQAMDKVVAELDRLIGGVSEAQLDDATPCSDWTVKDLIAHLVGGAAMFADAFAGRTPAMEPPSLPNDVGAIARMWAENRDAVVGEFKADVADDAIVQLPWGEMPRGAAIDLTIFDVTTHACDLAVATGQPAPPDAVVDVALDLGRVMVGDQMRVPGFFDAEQSPPEGATGAQRLLAFAGRHL